MSTSKQNIYEVGDVFVVGGQPTITYTARADAQVTTSLTRYLQTRPGKIVVVTGPSKSGKTVLVGHMAPTAVRVSGGDVGSLDQFWSVVADELPVWTGESAARAVGRDEGTEDAVRGGVKIPVAEVGGEHKYKKGRGEQLTHTQSRDRTAQQVAKAELIAAKTQPVFVDDFHHIEASVQRQVVRALKDLIRNRVPVILAAVPHRVVDVVTREREMSGRVDGFAVVPWTVDELKGIAATGFDEALNVECPEAVATRLARESFGSPHLMQDLCLELALNYDITQTVPKRVRIGPPKDGWDSFLPVIAERHVVDDTYRSLKSGPRERSDRIPRPLKDGGDVDTYALILKVISIALGRAIEDETRAEPTTLTWTEIRPILNDILAAKVPAWHEVKRALNKMHEIAEKLASAAQPDDPYGSEPVLVFEPEKELVHITDPFFLFQLRWHK